MPETSEIPYESTGSDGATGLAVQVEVIDTRPKRAGRGQGKHLTNRQRARVQSAFLAAFSHYGNMGHAARLAGIDRSSVYSWLETDERFAAEFRVAEDAALNILEQEAWRRAVEGSPYERTSYWHGEPVGTDRKIEYSDALMTLLLRARAPEKYREKLDVNVQQVVKTVVGLDPSEVL